MTSFTREEIKAARDRGDISAAHASVMLRSVIRAEPKTVQTEPVVPDPMAPIAAAIDNAAIKSNESIQLQTSMIEKVLSSVVLSSKAKPVAQRIVKFTVSRDSKNLITEIVPHYAKI